MNRFLLLAYQGAAGISDTLTGALLIASPAFTLRLMHLSVPSDALPYLAFIGSFVMAVGLCYLYAELLVGRKDCVGRAEAVWLVTAVIRSSVAIFVVSAVLRGAIPSGWLTVAAFDGACVLIQALGLRKGWLRHAVR